MTNPKTGTQEITFASRFSAYFQTDVAKAAAAPLSNGVEIELRVQAPENSGPLEVFVFTRKLGQNTIEIRAASKPQIAFTLSPASAEKILDHHSDDIAEMGIFLLHLLTASDANERISFKMKAGFFTLFGLGYFGVIKLGGASFASVLASKGISGIHAIKALLKKATGGDS